MNDDISNQSTSKLPETPQPQPIDPDNIDWTGEVTDARLIKVPRIFDQYTVNEALYSERSHILNSYTKELGSENDSDFNMLRSRLVDYINDLLNDSSSASAARSVLSTNRREGGYGFITINGLHAITPDDFELLGSRNPNTFPQTLINYQQERLVLVQAMEQALTLIATNKTLKNLVSTFLLYNGNVPEDELVKLHDLVRDSGLNIWIENTWNGFKGDTRNHGTLVYFNGKIRLNLDLVGRYSVQEIAHEFAAFLIIQATGRNITSQEELDNAKHTDLTYLLLMIDLLLGGVSHTSRYTNLAGSDLR
jgi:hypothetical protein